MTRLLSLIFRRRSPLGLAAQPWSATGTRVLALHIAEASKPYAGIKPLLEGW